MKIFNSLKATSSSLSKIKILQEHKNNKLLEEILYNTYSPRVRYYVKSDTISIPSQTGDGELSEAIYSLDRVKNRIVTGNAARTFIETVLSNLSKENQEVVLNMLDGDQKCGINHSTINKVWDNLIKYPEVMLASTDVKNIEYPAYSQVKADGVRVIYQDGIFQTRNGSIVEVFDNFEWLGNMTLDGEFVCYINDIPMDRKTSNGIINKAVKGTISKEEAKMIRFLVWDTPNDEKYHKRFEDLEKFVMQNQGKNLILIGSKLVNSYEDALEHFQEVRSQGLEGTILKNRFSKFENKRSKNLVKMKAEYEADLKVVGFEYGTGKNAGLIGNLLLESDDGLVKCSCGIFKDFPEEIRKDWLSDMPKIVTVRYNERINSKGRQTESLFLPRIIARRDDKDTCDTREKMIAEENSVKV